MFPVFPPDVIVLFLLVFFRILSLVVVLPVTGAEEIPPLLKIGLSFFLAVLIWLNMKTGVHPVPRGFGAVAFAAVGEIFIGLAMGLSVRAVLEAVNMAGNVVGFQMGFTIANVIDPQTGSQISIIGNLQVMIAAVIFLVSGLYLRFIEGIVRSFEIVGPGMGSLRYGGINTVIEIGGNIFAQAVSIGAPWIVTLLLANVAMGLMARTFPQMNIFFVGFPVTIGVGFIVMAVATPFVFAAVRSFLEGSERQFWEMLRAMMPG